MPMNPLNQQKSETPRERVDRRQFLSAATALAGSALAMGRAPSVAKAAPVPVPANLAVNGGTPVRATPLEAKLSGPQYYDDAEKQEVLDVINNRSPFRWW